MKYVVITTSLIEFLYKLRKEQYIKCITQTIKLFKPLGYKIVILENNGNINTFLNDFGEDVLYTNTNNTCHLTNIGYKELTDIRIFLDKYNVQDTDFIVKVTGRYFILDNSSFISSLKKSDYEAIFTYGNGNTLIGAAACGLIGLSGKWFRQVELPIDNTYSVEGCYGICCMKIQNTTSNYKNLTMLGILQAPSYYGMDNYVLI